MARQLPNLTVLDTEGHEVDLRHLAKERPLVLAYVRHFG